MYQNRLRDLWEDRDLKQKDLAQLLKVHQTSYSDYERDRLNIPVSVLHTLADFYHVSTDYLLGRTNTRKNKQKTCCGRNRPFHFAILGLAVRFSR